MSLTPELTARFVSLLSTLAPSADASPARAFFEEHADACLAAVGDVPGSSQLRAGLLRLLPALSLDEAQALSMLEDADRARASYAPESQDGADALRRPAAWVALASLELDERREVADADAVARALDLATRGFHALDRTAAGGAGEVLWAMAEASAEVGWMDRALPLLEAALEAPFEEADNRARVRLVRILLKLDLGDEAVDEDLEALLAESVVDQQTHVHALWIGAMRDRAAGRVARAMARLEETRGMVDAEDEPDVATRIAEAITAMGVGRDPAEA